ncbi:MAG: DNA replication and repair protein RecF [Candidatus Gottesmanbacteria bacterium]
MRLVGISLKKFRMYNEQSFTFSPTVTVFIGNNAIGKTNILEAIALCATGKSFWAVRDSDMITWGNDVSRVKSVVVPSTVAKDKEETILEIVLTSGMMNGQKTQVKKYLVNGVARRQLDFVGNIRVVLFSPTDLELVTDSPSIRREYLNTVLTQVDREYRRNIQSYERGLRQRNSLLDRINEGTAARSQLLFWNQLLIKTGNYITESRRQFIDQVNTYTLDDLHYRLVYDPSLISSSRLEQYKEEEIAAKSTLVGPQRDDFRFEKSGLKNTYIDISRFGSRGEQRLAVLWLKLSELTFIEMRSGDRPLLLLDDIFSELDADSRHLVLDVITKQQTIITSAEEEVIDLVRKIPDVTIIPLPVSKPV